MSESKFRVKKITKVSEVQVGDEIPTSDFSLLDEKDRFIQWEHIAEETDKNIEAKPGIFTIVKDAMGNLVLESTSFTTNYIYDKYGVTDKIVAKAENFFSKQHVYEKYKMFPRRGALLWGPAGTGKSSSITKIANKYANEDAIVILWPTSAFRPEDVKWLLKHITYTEAKKLILIAEDIGGAEHTQGKMIITAALLSLLDNVEQTFKVPTFILATTNYPENLLEVLTNRPGRFDDVIEVPTPNSDQRSELLKFFLKEAFNDELDTKIKLKKYDGFTVAHLQDIPIKSELDDITYLEAIDRINEARTKAKNDFQKVKSSMGIGVVDDDF